MIDERTVRQWFDIFKSPARLTEVRIIGNGKTFSGYFTNPDKLIAAIKGYDGYGIYATINDIDPSCYGRTQHDCIIQKPKSTTADPDISNRSIILIDLDPERKSDTNSTDEEKGWAWQTATRVYAFLRDQGFNPPVIADSANGYHLSYRVSIPNDDDGKKLVENFLKVLDMYFSDDRVKVDTTVFNASRIAKITGTSSNKGANTAERPQRMSWFVRVPDEFKATDSAYIRKVADMLPKKEEPTRFNNYSRERYDIDAFLERHKIEVAKRSRFQGGERIVLKNCPFNDNHADSAIFVLDNGGISFSCFHNSDRDKTWRDVLAHYEPESVSKGEYEEHSRKMRYLPEYRKTPPQPVPEDGRGKKWKTMNDIEWKDPSETPYIATGIRAIDDKILGLMYGDVTIISGMSGAGKTTVLDHLILSAIQQGFKCAVWSGEVQDFRFQSWLDQMAAGKSFVVPKYGYDNIYYCPRHISRKINDWLGDRLLIYNNDYGAKWSQLFADIKECVAENGVGLVLIDNLMSTQLDLYDGDKNEKQTQFINDLKELAKRENIHIVIVCHPRKEMRMELIRKDSVAGNADLTNTCDNLFLLHRVGNDFERRGAQFFGKQRMSEMMCYDLVIEIAKNRAFGTTDILVGVYYEQESRRIKNDPAEYVTYGWQETTEEIDDLPL